MDTAVLDSIGLARTEVKTLLALLELGEAKASTIMEKSGLQSSSFYHAVRALIAKGFVSYVLKSCVKYYRAQDPEVILDYLELRKQEFARILPELKARRATQELDSVELFKSYKGIQAMHLKLLRDAKKGDTLRAFSVDDPKEYATARQKVFRFVKQVIMEKKIRLKTISSDKNRYPTKPTTVAQKRYLKIPLLPNTSIVNGKVAIISWTNSPLAVLISSEELAKQYTEFFEAIWRIAKP